VGLRPTPRRSLRRGEEGNPGSGGVLRGVAAPPSTTRPEGHHTAAVSTHARSTAGATRAEPCETRTQGCSAGHRRLTPSQRQRRRPAGARREPRPGATLDPDRGRPRDQHPARHPPVSTGPGEHGHHDEQQRPGAGQAGDEGRVHHARAAARHTRSGHGQCGAGGDRGAHCRGHRRTSWRRCSSELRPDRPGPSSRSPNAHRPTLEGALSFAPASRSREAQHQQPLSARCSDVGEREAHWSGSLASRAACAGRVMVMTGVPSC